MTLAVKKVRNKEMTIRINDIIFQKIY